MKNSTFFPREERADVLFEKILHDPWACERLQETFYNYLFCNDEFDSSLSSQDFSEALFDAYQNKDLSAFLMAICQNTLFDLLRNSYLIPYRFNADGKENPIIMTDDTGRLLPKYCGDIHNKDYQHFLESYRDLGEPKNMYFAQAYRYSHAYSGEDTIGQLVLENSNGVLLIRELPDTIKQKETEAEAYSAIFDLVLKLEKELPMAFVFYGQDSLVEHNEKYDEIGIFLPNSIFLKNLERHIAKAEAIIYE